MEQGGLFLVATPIGNLGDMTYRAVETLKQVDYVLAEDTRVTGKLLRHFDISKQIVSCHEHNQFDRVAEIITDIQAGKQIALVSDAGMPCISDPGSVIVEALIAEQLPFTMIPGASAGVSAYAMSGMSQEGKFIFHGFLPTKQTARHAELARYAKSDMPVIFYESPNRIVKTLADFQAVFPGKTKVAIFRELTKLHESISWVILDTLTTESAEQLDTWKGEIVIVVQPVQDAVEWTDARMLAEMSQLVADGMRVKEATKLLSPITGQSARALYSLWEEQKGNA